MSEILDRIKSRGYWKVVIRPTTFVEQRVADRSALLSIIERNSVDLKGWSFPHVDSLVEIEKGPDWIGQEISRDPVLELWRFYQSGQFVHYLGIPEDWRTGAHQWPLSGNGVHRGMLDVAGVVLQLTEIYEFAARFCFTQAVDNGIFLEITVDNIEDHFLYLPEIGSQEGSEISKTGSPGIDYAICLSNIEIVAEARELSLWPALELFRSFQWDPGVDFVRELQLELIRRVPSATGYR